MNEGTRPTAVSGANVEVKLCQSSKRAARVNGKNIASYLSMLKASTIEYS